MLQQTQVATVIPYYKRFLRRFPTVRALAKAELDEVLRFWAGLGYYSRARSLHKAARTVVGAQRGRLPEDVDALQALPGVGRYTAGAVASIAFGVRAAVVDGNVARVLSRLFAIDVDVRDGAGRDLAWRIAERLVPQKRCGDFNQAVMELGATVCLPGAAARCVTCPLRKCCAARASGRVAELPARTRRAIVMEETHVVAAIERAGRWLFVRRPPTGLWGGMWSLPSRALNGEATALLARQLADELGIRSARIGRKPFCDVTHQLTHRTIRFVGHVCATDNRIARPNRNVRWLQLSECESLGLSRATKKILASLPSADGV